ncbi:MAG: hypothetical protein R3A45_07570 [Bdellovibrionota bacterium]
MIQTHGNNKASIQNLATQVMQSVQQATVVTPFQIIACAILTLSTPLFEDDLYQACLQIKQYLESAGVMLTDEAKNFEQNFPNIVDKILKKRMGQQTTGIFSSLSMPTEQRFIITCTLFYIFLLLRC